ncbi:ABC transporter ATP-binding protein [Marinomonas epiphytica]
MTELIRLQGLHKSFPVRRGWFSPWRSKKQRLKLGVHALNGVDISVERGETLCIVGETGCGKSTLARVLIGLEKPDSGLVLYQGEEISAMNDKQRMPYRKNMQMVFQNPYASLNPRMTVYQILLEAVALHHPELTRKQQDQLILEQLESVGLGQDAEDRFPHEFSGGQRQRISLARALSVGPELIIADEPLAALDVSVQAQVLNLMMDKQAEHGLTYLFITHDLAVVEHFASRVVVMYLGRVCEIADRDTLFSHAKHPYTQALLASMPRLDKLDEPTSHLSGEVPKVYQAIEGCSFANRCPYATQRCFEQVPELKLQEDNSSVACHGIEEGRLWK